MSCGGFVASSFGRRLSCGFGQLEFAFQLHCRIADLDSLDSNYVAFQGVDFLESRLRGTPGDLLHTTTHQSTWLGGPTEGGTSERRRLAISKGDSHPETSATSRSYSFWSHDWWSAGQTRLAAPSSKPPQWQRSEVTSLIAREIDIETKCFVLVFTSSFRFRYYYYAFPRSRYKL